MFIRKVCGTVAALVLFGGYSSAVLADCYQDRIDAIDDTMALARAVGCTDYPAHIDGITGNWVPANPVWQFKPKRNGNGCEVHYKLTKKLDEKPQKEKVKGKSKIDSRGVAALLEDGSDQNAYEMLQSFMDTIMYNAKLNPAYDDTLSPGFPTAAGAVQHFLGEAYSLQMDVNDLLLSCQ